MFKKTHLGLAVAAAIALPAVSQAEIETTVILKNETAAFLRDGMRTGEATSTTDTDGDGRKFYKSETSARIFFNGDIGEDSSWHGELNVIYDPLAESGYKGHENYSQHDWLRELYVDTKAAGWDVRLGKQQVVWGTADGMKLLDIINPTDYREFSQNAMEDSRIPIWMLNAERYVGDSANVQLIVSQVEENKVPGLNANGDSGHPFIMKGVDSITGEVNGFLNVAPALGGVASNFSEVARLAPGGMMGFDTGDGGNPGTGDGVADAMPTALTGFGGLTVDGFAGMNQFTNATGSVICADPQGCGPTVTTATPGGALLENFAENGAAFGLPFSNNNVTNLSDASGYVSSSPTAAFEYMSMATFATFNTYAANTATGVPSAVTKYVRDYPETASANAGFRLRNSTSGGLNYSVNYFYHYDANPVVNVSWHDAQTGERLTTVLARNGAYANGYFADPNNDSGTGGTVTVDALPTAFTPDAFGNASDAVSVLLQGSTGYYGAVTPNTNDAGLAYSAQATNGTELRFTESLNRIHSLGGSFDYAVDALDTPVVIRGEFLYDKDVAQPLVNKQAMAIGDLEHALTTTEADFFKYVIGADVTVLTNLFVSGQFIQFRNLDFVDTPRTCTTQIGNTFDCSTYTADPSTLHMSNGLQKGWKNKEFYSFYLSKPFGPSEEGRWNNIIIYEEGGGYWDRLDAEYSLSDQVVLTGEINMYWGDEDTTFGQFKNSSNAQVGVKWILE